MVEKKEIVLIDIIEGKEIVGIKVDNIEKLLELNVIENIGVNDLCNGSEIEKDIIFCAVVN